MKRRSVIFEKPYRVAIKDDILAEPGKGEVLIETQFSAISAGTELLVYQGLIPPDVKIDATIEALAGTFHYPLKYGYTTVGKVRAIGSEVHPELSGRRVFCFHPHESAFLARPEDVILLPAALDPLDALFLPNMETAVNFLMDGRTLIGERVVVLGQGIVGLLTTALLGRFPLAVLACVDRYPLRRQTALNLGADATFDPQDENFSLQLQQFLTQREHGGLADLVYELSGNPHALNTAIQVAGFHARIVVGSWYGQKRTDVDFGGSFHRNRIQLISSQVSSLAPEYSGRWTKDRRLGVVLAMIHDMHPSRFITHTFRIEQAAQAYDLLASRSENVLQVVFTY